MSKDENAKKIYESKPAQDSENTASNAMSKAKKPIAAPEMKGSKMEDSEITEEESEGEAAAKRQILPSPNKMNTKSMCSMCSMRGLRRDRRRHTTTLRRKETKMSASKTHMYPSCLNSENK
jgi:hypothetical protein